MKRLLDRRLTFTKTIYKEESNISFDKNTIVEVVSINQDNDYDSSSKAIIKIEDKYYYIDTKYLTKSII